MLNLSGCGLTDAAVSALARTIKILPYIPVLYSIDLSNNHLTDKVMKPLLSILKRLPVLRSICISDNIEITQDSFASIKRVVVNCTELKHFFIARTGISDEQVVAMRGAISDHIQFIVSSETHKSSEVEINSNNPS